MSDSTGEAGEMTESTDTTAPEMGRREALVPLPRAARVLGRSRDTLDDWTVAPVLMPVVASPGGRSTFASWLDAVLASPRPGEPGRIVEVSRQWWADRGVDLKAVA